GAVLLALGLASLLLAFNALPRLGEGDRLAVFLLPLSAVSLAGFIAWENRAAQPIIRIELFRNPAFAVVNLAFTLINLVAFAVMLSLGLHGLGMGFFQVAYMELVLAASPLAHRGVAGSLSMLTRTIGTVTGAALLTLGFQSIQSAVHAGGADDAQAFLTAFHTVFRFAGIAAGLTGVLVALIVRRDPNGRIGRGL